MTYLSPFKNDLFISYARVDDQKDPDKEKGWVTLLHEYLEIELSKRFGRMDVISIWRDTRQIGGSTYFDEAIKTSIKESAIFLSLTSRGYLSPESYCIKELKCFYEKAQQEKYGLRIGTRSRLFNVLVQNIPRGEWPAEFAYTSGLTFHDAQRPDQFGEPSEPDDPLFTKQLRQLVDEIYAALCDFKKAVPFVPDEEARAPGDQYDSPFTVFLAHTEGPLLATKRRVTEELRQKGVRVAASVPPPYEAKPHEQTVTAEIRQAHLSVHLLDDAPGLEIEGEPGKSYYQKQAELGLRYAKSQLIWVPKTLDVKTIEDPSYSSFLDQLENGRRGEATYSFIRESPGSITREILAKINQLSTDKEKPSSPPSKAALLDAHLKDQLYALDLSRFFVERKVKLYMNPEEDDPQKNITLFQEMLKQVSVLIIIYGQVAAEWVRERLISALQIAINEKCPLKLCGIYLAPADGQVDDRESRLGNFPVTLPILLFKRPETLTDLLDGFVER